MAAYFFAFGVCSVAIAIETLCAGKDPMRQLAALKQPLWAPPAWLWILLGLFWYGICFVALVRLYAIADVWPQLPALLFATMLANAGANIPQFRMRRLDIAFFYLFPYWALLAGFMLGVAGVDAVTFRLFALYSAYQVYAAFWAWRLWRLNGARPA